MSRPDYTEFDAELLAQIAAGKNRAGLLCDQKHILKMAEPFCTNDTPGWRVIDRRLQALRKSGKIEFNGKVWEVVQA